MSVTELDPLARFHIEKGRGVAPAMPETRDPPEQAATNEPSEHRNVRLRSIPATRFYLADGVSKIIDRMQIYDITIEQANPLEERISILCTGGGIILIVGRGLEPLAHDLHLAQVFAVRAGMLDNGIGHVDRVVFERQS